MLFAVYVLPLGIIFQKYAILYQLRADDSQSYILITPAHANLKEIQCFDMCLTDVKSWMDTNKLKFNLSKT